MMGEQGGYSPKLGVTKGHFVLYDNHGEIQRIRIGTLHERELNGLNYVQVPPGEYTHGWRVDPRTKRLYQVDP